MEQIYEKHKDEDGFLYLTYQDMEDKGGNWLKYPLEAKWFCMTYDWHSFR